MYRFLMVDDEEIVRRGFEAKIDWAKAGFEFLPPRENGRDAIAAIDELEPDVVMTDIHMPHADGISVAAHVMERHPGILVVILSGYDEFGYAQAAIRNKVFDYVLKPVSSRDLIALLAKIKGKLDADRRSREDEDALKAIAETSGGLMRERSLFDFATGSGAAPSAAEAEAFLGFAPGQMACAAIVAEPDEEASAGGRGLPAKGPGALGAPELRLRLEAARRLARRSAAFVAPDGRVAALVFDSEPERCTQAAMAAASALHGACSPLVRVGVGRAFGKWIDAPRSYSEAAAALSFRLARGNSGPFAYHQAGEGRDALALLKEREERLCLALRTGAAERVSELARSFLDALGDADISPQRMRHEAIALFSRAHDELAGIGVSSTALSAKLAGDYYRFAEGLGTREAVLAALSRLAEVAAATLESSSLHEPEWKVLDFKELVARHYADKGLSLGKAAERLSISESYLSKLLRRRLGLSFVEYLADYRVGRAKELLSSSDMLSYEIAEAVGYPDARYFASLFKKKTGMTPSEYRASLGRDGEGPPR
jgi:two-component system, response regulator YesN